MSSKCLLVAALLLLGSDAAFAQGTQQSHPRARISAGVATTGMSHAPVATQPSNNPFQNPIGQGVPPAVSTNGYLNNNRTYVPITR
jgi:hypothetical protein